MLIRVSIGSLAVLGLEDIKMLARPTTLYTLQYSETGCAAACKFCAQSRLSEAGKDYLSRVLWPAVPLDDLVRALRSKPGSFKRFCIQNVIKEGFKEELLYIAKTLTSADSETPLSVATTPVGRDYLLELKRAGTEMLGVGLDAASPQIFVESGKPYTWDAYWKFIGDAIEVYGRGKVTVHLIFGLGETEREFVETMARVYGLGATVALFAFTPIPGTPFASRNPPPINRYRVIQAIRYLLDKGYELGEIAEFEGKSVKLREKALKELSSDAYLTSGCPGCNRPFYNESPRKIYNFPSKSLISRG